MPVLNPRPQPLPAVRSIPSSQLIASRLRRLRTRHVSVAVGAGLALAASVAIELLAIAMFLDWWLDLPRLARVVLLLGQAAIVGFILVRQVLLPLVRRPDEDDLALMVEKARPEFRGQLISTVQLTRPGAIPPGASSSLVDVMVEQTEARVAGQDFRAIVPTERFKMFLGMAALVLLIGGGGFFYGGDTTYDLLRRVFLSNVPVPRKTQVTVPNGDHVIGRGDDIRLEAFARGIVPAEGKLEVRHASRRVQEFALEQNEANEAHFGRTLENVQESFTYRIHLNDGVSDIHTVTAIPRPTVAAIECTQFYPAYTGLEPEPRSIGDLALLAGSRLRVRITATKDITQAGIRLVGPDEIKLMAIDENDPRRLSGEFTVPASGMNGFSILMVDTEEMESRDAAVYRVEIIPDKAPQVRLLRPDRKEELVTRTASPRFNISLQDDFGVARVRLHYKVTLFETGPEQIRELEPAEIDRLLLPPRREGFDWDLTRVRPPIIEGTLIEYWFEAVDHNDATGPGVGSSEHQLLRVVSYAEKLADAWNRASDSLSGIEEVTEDQENANKKLGTIILEDNAEP